MAKKFIVIPDSFKGSLSSAAICGIMKQSIQAQYPSADVVQIPVADGGEGSVDAFLSALKGEKKPVTVKGPFGEPTEAFYGVVNGSTAVIEMAACAGLPLAEGRLNPCTATTYGVGELIAAAVSSGCKKIIVGLGGSCTNDAGAGMAAALGVKFYDRDGKAFVPAGGTLQDVNSIDLSGLDSRLAKTEIVTMCDIDNPLYGPTGAAYIFAPQKGADEATVRLLDAGLKHFSDVIQKDLKTDVSQIPGSGAAGGMGAGMVAFLHSKLQMGIETVLDTVHFDQLLKDTDMVFTGEGKIDTQSLRGKVVIGVAKRAKRAGVPVIAVVGDVGDQIDDAYTMGVTSIFSINRVAVEFKEARKRSSKDLRAAMDDIMRLMRRVGF